MKFAPEGYPFITFFAALSGIVFWIGGGGVALISLLLTVFMFYFFRDPERKVPEGKNIFVAPADGKIIVIRDILEAEHLHKDVRQISIFMSPFNVHVNRVPCDGRVKTVRHVKGKFLAAYKDEASMQNEHIDMVFETRYGDLLLRQVAGFVARRAVCRKSEGDALQAGERYGLIKFSSRVDIYLPKDAVITVRMGDMVRAGETVLGRISGG
ncbi:MAG: phosphatidylserine decarboxylase family protein [Nitrospirae bacterium]|nr:phosphatidylserine decarboxylase family protein [Nitrospirota bacterium]